MRYIQIYLAIFFLIFGFLSCKKDGEGTLRINYKAIVNQQPLQLNTPYLIGTDTIVFERFNMYISDMKIYNKDEENYISLEEVNLIKYGDMETIVSDFVLPQNAYKNFYLTLGLTDDLNAKDPSSFASDHPLSSDQGNYWLMANSYVYVKIEGKYHNGTTTPLAYHIGLDGMGRELSNTTKGYSIHDGNVTNLFFKIDINQFLDALNLPSESDTHTTDNMPLAEKVVDALQNAISIY